MSGARLKAKPSFRPILIRRGALGENRPRKDTRLSPQHRVLVRGAQAEFLFGEREVLVSAKDLVDGEAILVDEAQDDVTYLHLYFECHHIIFADGLEAESFRPGVAGFSALPDEARDEFEALFPEHDLDGPSQVEACRLMLKAWEARLLCDLTEART